MTTRSILRSAAWPTLAATIVLVGCGVDWRDGSGRSVPPPLGGVQAQTGVDRFAGEVGPGTDDHDGFPLSLPIHPDARLIASIKQQGMGQVRTYAVPQPADETLDYHLRRLREAGFSLDFDGRVEGMPMLGLSRGAERIRLSVEQSGGGSLLHLAAAPTR